MINQEFIDFLRFQLLNNKPVNSKETSRTLFKLDAKNVISYFLNHKNTIQIDVKICNQLIQLLSRDWGIIRAIYNLLLETNLADKYTFPAFIKVCIQHVNLYAGIAAYETALERHCESAILFKSGIDLADSLGDFTRAEEVYEKAKKARLLDKITLTHFIQAAGNAKCLTSAKAAYTQSLTWKAYDKFTFTFYMIAAGNCEDFLEAKAAYEKAITLSCYDGFTFRTIIDIAGKHGDLATCKLAYEKALTLRCHNSFIFNSYITVTGKYGYMSAAKGAFKKSLNLGCYDSFIFTSIINSAAENGDFPTALGAFNISKEKKCENICTVNAFIKAAVLSNKVALAEKAFLSRLDYYLGKRDFHIDLHGHNAQTVKLLMTWLVNQGKPGKYIFIIGQGKHSEGESPVLKAFYDYCNQNKIIIDPDFHNAGKVFIRLAPKKETLNLVPKKLFSPLGFFKAPDEFRPIQGFLNEQQAFSKKF